MEASQTEARISDTEPEIKLPEKLSFCKLYLWTLAKTDCTVKVDNGQLSHTALGKSPGFTRTWSCTTYTGLRVCPAL